MSFLGGIAKSLVNPMTLAQLAMGPAGWASIAMKALTSAVAQQAIQMVGQQLGLPQQAINMAQSAFSAASGGQNLGNNPIGSAVSSLAEQFQLSPREQGDLTRTAENAARRLSDSMLESEEFKSAKSGGGKGSIFMQIAVALGKLADKKMGEMATLANDIGGIKDGKNANAVTQKTGEMQAKGQEFGLLSNAMSNAVKSIGEGMTQLARKG